MARGSAGATLVVMTDDLDHGHRATSRLYRLPAFGVPLAFPGSRHMCRATQRLTTRAAGPTKSCSSPHGPCGLRTTMPVGNSQKFCE